MPEKGRARMPEFFLPITAWVAAILGAFFLWQTWRVISYRRANGIVLTESDDRGFIKRVRGQANAAEQLPIGLILLALNEWLNPAWFVLLIAALFVIGRISHGLYFAYHGLPHQMRVLGMMATLTAQGLLVIGLVAGLL